MNILFLTFYFTPDFGAGSFRSEALIRQLIKGIDENDTITLITTTPNRYSDYLSSVMKGDYGNNVNIIRISVPKHKNGFLDQVFCFLFYLFGVLRHTRKQKYDLVFATSSRLFTAWLAKILSAYHGALLYLDIRDIFSKVFKELFAKSSIRFIYPVIKKIEKHAFSTATKINIVSRGFKPYFDDNYSNIELSFYTNGIDSEFLDYNWSKANNKKVKVCYAGNIGEGQGLHKIIPHLAAKLCASHEFHILGDGGKKSALIKSVDQYNLDNVFVLAATNRKNLIKFYDQADILFLHLNDFKAFEDVLPSKMFEYAATNKPILAGISGYARYFLEKEVQNIAIFNPCDADEAADNIDTLDIELLERSAFKIKFDRQKIMRDLSIDILSIID